MSSASLNRSALGKLDWITLVTYICLILIGWMMIYASGYSELSETVTPFFKTSAGKQLMAIIISAFLFLVVFITDSKFWSTLAYPIYLLGLISLILVLFLGHKIKGSVSWFNLGGFSFQPSEFAKFGTALAMAAYISYYKTNLKQPKSRMITMGIFALPIGLILLQPDAGSAITYGSFFILLFREGYNPVWYIIGLSLLALFILALKFEPYYVIAYLICFGATIIYTQLKKNRLLNVVLLTCWGLLIASYWVSIPLLSLVGVLSVGLLFFVYQGNKQRLQKLLIILVPSILVGAAFTKVSQHSVDNFLKPHQRERINVWLRPEMCDPRGNLYHVLQSKLAISSGNFSGKGFLQGTLTKLNYVPEQSTDFIFSTIGEEQGFLGIAAIVGLFVLLMFRAILIGERARNAFTRVYAYSYMGFILVHFFINIGMTMGLVPIMGIPLPFISYGGTSCMIFSLMTAVLLKLDTARHSV
ncbi:MAG: rod shape-determining protein RodA [Saprospiraceae bacterium]|nr:rod shape-determining protein RodA [Saprospiraceae bacterium]MBK9678656.1 rod shape-determining protein RodA [Saprospiraceae bacterium]